MEILVTIIHALVAFLLVITILLQSGKGGGLAGSLGGGGMDGSSVLGGRTAASFLVKSTSVLATVFMLSCLMQSIIFQSSDDAPISATERMLEGEAPPVVPISEAPGFLEEPAATEEAAGEAVPAGGTGEAADGAAE